MSKNTVPSKTATKVKDLTGKFRGSAALYRLDPPLAEVDWRTGEPTGKTIEHVVVSAVVAYSGPETYIFPADAGGKITDWGELDGSFQGGLDHEEALNGAGYEVAS